MKELSKTYSPKEIESKWYPIWEEKIFCRNIGRGKGNYSIVIPPPNVTGILHMGHVLNNSIQDTLVRYQRMTGKILYGYRDVIMRGLQLKTRWNES